MSSPQSESKILHTSSHTRQLVDALQPHSEIKRIVARKRLPLSTSQSGYCYLIISGRVTLYRDDDIALATFSAPSVVGLANMAQHVLEGYIKVQTNAEIGVLPLTQLQGVIREHNLWEKVALHMMVIAGKMYTSSRQLTAATSYEIIKAQLVELSCEDEAVRNSITMGDYIRERTNLSRSGIMRILAELKQGGYVETKRGILLRINSLPEKF